MTKMLLTHDRSKGENKKNDPLTDDDLPRLQGALQLGAHKSESKVVASLDLKMQVEALRGHGLAKPRHKLGPVAGGGLEIALGTQQHTNIMSIKIINNQHYNTHYKNCNIISKILYQK